MNGNQAGKHMWRIQACLATHLDEWIDDHFAGLEMRRTSDGNTLLAGKLPDVCAVYGLILQLRDTGIELLSLHVERQLVHGGDIFGQTRGFS